jgi:phage tail-like protein
MPEPRAANHLIANIEGFGRTPLEYVDGMGGVVDVLEFKDGPDVNVRLRAGRTTWDSITLRRTQFGKPALWKWWYETVHGAGRRRDVTLSLTDRGGAAIAGWTLRGCWPSRWRLVHTVGAGGESGYVEEVTLVVEDIDLG